MTRTAFGKTEIVQLVEDQAKNYKDLTQTEGLAFIADRLNEILRRVRVEERYGLKDSSSFLDLLKDDPLLQETPDSGLQAYDPLKPWKAIEPIVEAMTGQLSWRKPFPQSLSSILKGQPWNFFPPKERDSFGPNKFPEISILYFNNLARQYPIPLFIFKGKGKEIYPEHKPTMEIQQALWYLWRFFFHDKGWERLKRCHQCLRWFVDETRNKGKLRCSRHCTDQWWSRDRRKENSPGTSEKMKRRKGESSLSRGKNIFR